MADREEKRAAKDAERAARQEQKQRVRSDREAEAALRKFLASPVGQATTAYDGGAGLFELELDSSVIRRGLMSAATIGGVDVKQVGLGQHTDVLSQVEAVGWRLEHVNRVYVMTGQVSRDKFLSSGQEVGVMGKVVGYYLFRRDQSRRDVALDSLSYDDLIDAVEREEEDQVG